MDYSDFSLAVSKYFIENGLGWVDSAIRSTLDEGVRTKKDALSYEMSTEISTRGDESEYFAESEDYTTAFRQRGTRKSVEGSRAFHPSETAQLYIDALYSILIEPDELVTASLKLFQDSVSTVMFSSEDGQNQFTVEQAPATTSDTLDRLRTLLESQVSSAT